jgi:hypothetical protein
MTRTILDSNQERRATRLEARLRRDLGVRGPAAKLQVHFAAIAAVLADVALATGDVAAHDRHACAAGRHLLGAIETNRHRRRKSGSRVSTTKDDTL